MAGLEDKVDRLADSVNSLVSTMTKGSPTGSSSASSAISNGNWISKFASAGNSAGDAALKFASGTFKATDAINLFTQASNAFGPVAGYVGQLTGKLGNAVVGVNEVANSMGNNGVRLGNDLGLLQKSTLGARMSLPELESTIKSSGKSITGLAYGADKSTLAFLNTAKKIQETDLAYQLQATGMSSEEFGKILTLVANNAKAGDITQASTQRLVIASAIKLATEFDNTARLTGISIEEQRKALEGQTKRKDVELAMMAMSEEQREALNQNLASTMKYGQTVQDATRIMALGGPVNEEEQKVVAALSPEMQDAVRRLAAVEGTGPEADKKRAVIQSEMDAIVLRQSYDKGYIQQQQLLYRAGDEQTKAIAAATLEQQRYAQIIAKADVESKKLGITAEEYKKRELERIGAQRKATTEGTVAPESKVAVGLNQAERLNKDISAGLGVGIDKLNTEVGSAANNFRILNNVLRPLTQSQAATLPEKGVAAIKEATGVKQSIPSSAKEVATGTKPIERQEGSFGAVGKFIEDFGKGTPAILHGKEGVITEKQFDGLFKNLQSKNSQPKVAELPTPVAATKAKSPTIEAKALVNETLSVDRIQNIATTNISQITQQFNGLVSSMNAIPASLKSSISSIKLPAVAAPPQKDLLADVNKIVNTLLNEKPLQKIRESNSAGVKQQPTLPPVLNKEKTTDSKNINQKIPVKDVSIESSGKQLTNALSGLQSSLSFELEKNKSNVLSTTDFKTAISEITKNYGTKDEAELKTPVPNLDMSAMSEMKDQLVQLNTMMSQLLSHTATVADNTDQQIRATRSLSGNLLS